MRRHLILYLCSHSYNCQLVTWKNRLLIPLAEVRAGCVWVVWPAPWPQIKSLTLCLSVCLSTFFSHFSHHTPLPLLPLMPALSLFCLSLSPPPPSALPSVQATGPFLHIGALAAATALSWIVAGQVARAERTSKFERETKLNYSSSLYWPGRKCGEWLTLCGQRPWPPPRRREITGIPASSCDVFQPGHLRLLSVRPGSMRAGKVGGRGGVSVKTVPGSGQTKKSFGNRERALSAVYF